MKWLADLPTTNARIAVTLLVFVLTACFSVFGQTHVESEWLIFLAVMAGLDAAQYTGKRLTWKETPPPAEPNRPDREDVAASQGRDAAIAVVNEADAGKPKID